MEIFRKKCTSQKINKKSDNGNEILKKIKNRKRNIKFSQTDRYYFRHLISSNRTSILKFIFNNTHNLKLRKKLIDLTV